MSLISILANTAICQTIASPLEEDPPLIQTQGNPAVIAEKIKKHGASTIRASLHYAGWRYVIQHIETGDKKWLEVGTALFPGTDAGATHSLKMAFSEALVVAPSEVLLLVPESRSKGICGVDVDNYDSYEKAMARNKKALKAVTSINDPELVKRKKPASKN